MRRRHLLALLGTVPLAGCTGSSKDAVVRTEQKSPPADAVIVEFNELPDEEQAIIQTAIDEKFYHACPPPPEAVHSFASRVNSGDPYLTHQNTQYGLWVRISDQVYATSASSPDTSRTCLL